MKKKIISSLLAASMIMTALTGCGGTDSGNNNATQDNATTVNNDSVDNADNAQEPADAAPEGDDAAASNEGKVINVYSFNDELRKRITAVYPEVVDTSDDGTTSSLKDGTEIHWIINPNQDGVYQDKLDEALNNQLTAADDDKVDIFAAEIDYVVKYTDADIDAAMPLEALGINPETDLADQFDFTKTVASDQNGVMRASTWQACPDRKSVV